MKIYKNTSTFFLLIALLLVGCGDSKNPASSNPAQTNNQSLALKSSKSGFEEFKSELKKLKENLSEKEIKIINLSQFNAQYNRVKTLNLELKILKNGDKNLLESLNKLDQLDSKIKSSPEVKALQKELGMSGTLDGQYGPDIRDKLLSRFEDMTQSLDSSTPQPVNLTSKTPTVQIPNNIDENSKTPNWLIASSIIGSILAILSLGANGFLFWRFKKSQSSLTDQSQSSLANQTNTLKDLDKRVSRYRDDFKKNEHNVNQKIEILTARQATIDQRLKYQESKFVGSPQSPQFSRRDDQEYSEAHNFPLAQETSLYVSSEHQSHLGVDSAPRIDQIQQSPCEMIAQQYNANPSAIATFAQGVSETEDSNYRRRLDSSIKRVILQSINNYSFWIISDPEGNYWLTPIPELKLNPMNSDTFQALFQFNGDPLGGKLQLIKPAKVTQASANQWELIDRGEVEFL
jgi:hypothetical protein